MSGRPRRDPKPLRKSGFLYESVTKKTKRIAPASAESTRKKAKTRTSKQKRNKSKESDEESEEEDARPATAVDREEEEQDEEEAAEAAAAAADEDADMEDARIFRNEPVAAFYVDQLRGLSRMSIHDDEEKKKEIDEQMRDAREGIVQQQLTNQLLRSGASGLEFSPEMDDLNQAADETRITKRSRVMLRNMYGRVEQILDEDAAASNMNVHVRMDDGSLQVAGLSDLTPLKEPQAAASWMAAEPATAAAAANAAFNEFVEAAVPARPPAVSASAVSQLDNVNNMFEVDSTVLNVRTREYGTVTMISLAGMTVMFGPGDSETFPLVDVLKPDFPLIPARMASQPSVHESERENSPRASGSQASEAGTFRRLKHVYKVGDEVYYKKKDIIGTVTDVTYQGVRLKFPASKPRTFSPEDALDRNGPIQPTSERIPTNNADAASLASSASSHRARHNQAAEMASHHSAVSRHSRHSARPAAASSAAAAGRQYIPLDEDDAEGLEREKDRMLDHLLQMLIFTRKARSIDSDEIGDVLRVSKDNVFIKFPSGERHYSANRLRDRMLLEPVFPSDPRLAQSRAAAASSQRIPIPARAAQAVAVHPDTVPRGHRAVTRSKVVRGGQLNPISLLSSSSEASSQASVHSAHAAPAASNARFFSRPAQPRRRVLPASAGNALHAPVILSDDEDIIDFQRPAAAAAGPARPTRYDPAVYTDNEEGDEDDEL